MSHTALELRTNIEEKKKHLSQTVDQLEDRFEEMTDWSGTIRRHPLTTLAVSLGIGLVLSGIKAPAAQTVANKTGSLAKSAMLTFLLALVK